MDDRVGQPPDARPRRRIGRVLAIVAVIVALLLAAFVGTVFVITEKIGNNVARVPDVFAGLDGSARPPANEALTFLLVGTDSRATEPTTGFDAPDGVDAGSQRSDVVMVARFEPNRTQATVVSIPRDSWVDVPGRGSNKINAAYAFGGPSLLIRTVENLTGLRIDHFAVIDFAGFRSMVDAMGGIDVRVAEATSNDGVAFHQGLNHLDGGQALAYVRQRYDLPRGDLDRAQRQQNALRALLTKAASSGMLSDPAGLYDLVDATSHTVSVDDTLTNGGIRDLALDLRGMRSAGVTFLSAPVGALGREGAQSVAYLDDVRSAELWSALRTGAPGDYARRYPADSLATTPS